MSQIIDALYSAIYGRKGAALEYFQDLNPENTLVEARERLSRSEGVTGGESPSSKKLEQYVEDDTALKWLSAQYGSLEPAIYSSVDIRHSGFKIAPIDVNAFPGGFNNLSEKQVGIASAALKEFLEKFYPSVRKVMLIPENHTRNQKYLDNVKVLNHLFENAGYEVKLAAIGESAGETGHALPVVTGGKITLKDGFVPDVVVLNNDLTSGTPSEISGISQPVIPSPLMGWHNRKKSCYFYHYDRLARDFAAEFGFDPWLISTYSEKCIYMNFHERKGLECAAIAVERVIRKVKEKYLEHGVKDEPYVFIKAESGTYGMGIMTAHSGDDVVHMNKNVRKKMNVIKEGLVNSEVIVQEGVVTADRLSGKAAEPMLYLVGGKFVGGAYRVNAERGEHGNMNGPGMDFVNLDATMLDGIDGAKYLELCSLIARIATLAVAREREFYMGGLTCAEKAASG